jgi:nitrite reductase (NO-forming)
VASVAGCAGAPQTERDPPPTGSAPVQTDTGTPAPKQTDVDSVAADPADLPDPVDRDSPATVEVDFEVREVTAEVEPGVTFDYMTFNGTVPGPMVRVRRGDTVELTVRNPEGNGMSHNVDFHAAYGTGGGAEATRTS